jgi:uncharacterized membrane protein YeaQ/YmgE (transglycosylase-associated protein family)
MGIVFLIISGAAVGWLGSRVAGVPQQGCLTNIVIGIGGSMLGGAVMNLITGEDLLFDFPTDPTEILLGFVASVIGAAVLILGLRALGRRG